MTTRSKYWRLNETEGPPYVSSCSLCRWWARFSSKRKARAGFLTHECIRELPEIPHELDDERWYRRAACLDGPHDPDLWFQPEHYDDAIAVCNDCPVIDDCLYAALAEERRHIPWGVRGGLLVEERNALRDIARG